MEVVVVVVTSATMTILHSTLHDRQKKPSTTTIADHSSNNGVNNLIMFFSRTKTPLHVAWSIERFETRDVLYFYLLVTFYWFQSSTLCHII